MIIRLNNLAKHLETYTVAVFNWDLNIYSMFGGCLFVCLFVCLFTYSKNLDLSLAWQLYNSLSVLPKYLTKGQNILLSSCYSNVVLVVCTDELTVLSYKQHGSPPPSITQHDVWDSVSSHILSLPLHLFSGNIYSFHTSNL